MDKNSNYTLANKNTFDFILFTKRADINKEGLNISMDGKFAGTGNIAIEKSTSKKLLGELAELDAKSYYAYSIAYTSYENQPVSASVNIYDFVSSPKRFKIYTLENGVLKEIKYTLDGGIAQFELKCSGDYVFVEEYNSLHTFRFVIFGLIVFAASSLSVVVVMYFVARRRYVENFLNIQK